VKAAKGAKGVKGAPAPGAKGVKGTLHGGLLAGISGPIKLKRVPQASTTQAPAATTGPIAQEQEQEEQREESHGEQTNDEKQVALDIVDIEYGARR
jgi:hypothetical protein